MKICKIIIKDFQQFKDFELDLTHPETGEPLDKVCFIGSNGTGKTTLLKDLNKLICASDRSKGFGNEIGRGRFVPKSIMYQISNDEIKHIEWNSGIKDKVAISEKNIDIILSKQLSFQSVNNNSKIHSIITEPAFTLKDNTKDLAIYVSSELNDTVFDNMEDVPKSTLNEALKLFKDFPFRHEVSSNTISQFWTMLIYLIKNRESEMIKLQEKPENQDKTIKQLREELDQIHPKILEGLAEIWNKILAKAGLEFDVEKANIPVQLTENLQAYIKLINSDTKIPYNQLSSGIRNFIFKVGHIYSLYFNRKIERGFLLIDEPENSLYPDFLYDLIEIYQNIIQNTQMFIATHSDILAAQFEPYERFILEFDENGYVQARRGTAPVGDDPNDILYKDFQVKNLMGKKGIEKWERYIELKTRIPRTDNKVEKKKLISEFMKIGNEYNFTPDYAISEQTN